MTSQGTNKGAELTSLAPDALRRRVEESLLRQGFAIAADGRLETVGLDKDSVRALHREAVRARVEKAREGLERHEARLLGYLANGHEVEPTAIRPSLREVLADSEEELLFRYARLHWSIPVSALSLIHI